MKMQFVDFVTGGSPQSMKVSETDIPIPEADQVLVKVFAFGLNRADTLQRKGKYPPPTGESEILGLEVSGEIVAVGRDVTEWRKGQAVFGLVAGGGYAQYVAVNQHHIMLQPQNITHQEAAGIAEVFITAYQSLFYHGALQAGQKVLIHAGASGVGLAAIQLAKLHGCWVAASASTDKKLDKCRQNGADITINYKQQDFAEVIKANWKGVDLIIDFVAGDYLNRNLKVLNADGKIVYLAMLAGRYADKLDMALLLGKRATIIGSTLRNRSDDYKTQLISEFNRHWLPHFNAGRLHASIDSFYSAHDIEIAHQRLEDNQTMGKLIGIWS
jgi:putative PIG3 family NAD(P)H quinone oxidoreductase